MHPLIMAIINCTPDSFYASSRCQSPEQIREHISTALKQGAHFIDFGGCSTRPNAASVSEGEEWARLEPALHIIKEEFPQAVVSIDTFRPGIVERAYKVIGSFWVNDICAGSFDSAMVPLIAQLELPWIAMFQEPYTRLDQVKSFFDRTVQTACKHGIKQLVLDPGFGFQKTEEQNYQLLMNLDKICPKDIPVLVGISRKRMTYQPFGLTPETALGPTNALHLQLLLKGASILRVHDVASAHHIIELYQKIRIFEDNKI